MPITVVPNPHSPSKMPAASSEARMRALSRSKEAVYLVLRTSNHNKICSELQVERHHNLNQAAIFLVT